MKIAIVIDSLGRGGAERQALYATGELARIGHNVELIYYHKTDSEYDSSALYSTKVIFLPKNGTYFRFLWRLWHYFKQGKFDVVHGFKAGPAIYACLAGRFARIPALFAGYRVEYRDKGLSRIAHKILNLFIDGWIVNSKAIINSMQSTIGENREKYFVVYNGVDNRSFMPRLSVAEAKKKLGINEDCKIITILARLRPQKNHIMFINMASHVLKDRPNTRFLIVGDGAERNVIERYAKSVGICDKVLFLGNRSDIVDILTATDVSVLTSHYEGLPNALIESMCAGVPIVSTDYPGIKELITDGREGLIVPRNDALTMAKKVCFLLDSESLRKQLGDNGIKTAEERFSLHSMVNSLIRIYKKTISKRS